MYKLTKVLAENAKGFYFKVEPLDGAFDNLMTIHPDLPHRVIGTHARVREDGCGPTRGQEVTEFLVQRFGPNYCFEDLERYAEVHQGGRCARC